MKEFSCVKCNEVAIASYKKNEDGPPGEELEFYLKCEKCNTFVVHPELANTSLAWLDHADFDGIIYTKSYGTWFPLEQKINRRKDHQKYLRTKKWQDIRLKVLKRDDYTCQGCLENRATEVHHITYDNWKNEFMFELMSLCRECHSRFHKKDKP